MAIGGRTIIIDPEGTVGDDSGVSVRGGVVETSNLAPADDGPGNDGTARRTRGRPPKRDGGSGGATAGTAPGKGGKSGAQKEIALDLSTIEIALTGIHAGIASLTGKPIWALAPEEATAAATAIKNVARHYPALAGGEKALDWIMLIQTIGMIYGTRLYLSQDEKKEKPKPEGAQWQ